MPNLDDEATDEAWIRSSVACSASPGQDGLPARCAADAVETGDHLHQQHHINNLPPAILHGVFGHLGPRDLATVSTVCQLWRQLNGDSAANLQWRGFYTNRWRVLGPSGDDVCWQTKYGSKMKQASWSVSHASALPRDRGWLRLGTTARLCVVLLG